MPKNFYFLVTIVFSFLPSLQANAQREVQMLQYLVNPLAINPAYAGSREVFHLNAILRRQWAINLPGLPVSQTFSMDGTADKNNRIGLGLQGLNDNTSGLNNVGVIVAGAYHYPLSETQKISVGVQGGFNVLPAYDAATGASVNTALASYGFGLRYEDDMMWLGVSMPEMANKSFSKAGTSLVSVLNYSRPMIINAGTKLLMSDDVVLRPSLLIAKQKGRGLAFDVNAEAIYKQKLAAGLSFRKTASSSGYFHALATYQSSKNILFGLTYTSTVPEAWSANGRGIFELVLTFVPNPKID